LRFGWIIPLLLVTAVAYPFVSYYYNFNPEFKLAVISVFGMRPLAASSATDCTYYTNKPTGTSYAVCIKARATGSGSLEVSAGVEVPPSTYSAGYPGYVVNRKYDIKLSGTVSGKNIPTDHRTDYAPVGKAGKDRYVVTLSSSVSGLSGTVYVQPYLVVDIYGCPTTSTVCTRENHFVFGPSMLVTVSSGSGGTCTTDADCSSGLKCINGKCQKPSPTCIHGYLGTCDGCKCQSGLICYQGKCHYDHSRDVGESCNADVDCKQGLVCNGGKCTSSNAPSNCNQCPYAGYKTCDASGRCLTCEVKPNGCLGWSRYPKCELDNAGSCESCWEKANGQQCDCDDECASGHCVSGICQPKSGPICGNGKCESGENPSNCPSDCPKGGKTCQRVSSLKVNSVETYDGVETRITGTITGCITSPITLTLDYDGDGIVDKSLTIKNLGTDSNGDTTSAYDFGKVTYPNTGTYTIKVCYGSTCASGTALVKKKGQVWLEVVPSKSALRKGGTTDVDVIVHNEMDNAVSGTLTVYKQKKSLAAWIATLATAGEIRDKYTESITVNAHSKKTLTYKFKFEGSRYIIIADFEYDGNKVSSESSTIEVEEQATDESGTTTGSAAMTTVQSIKETVEEHWQSVVVAIVLIIFGIFMLPSFTGGRVRYTKIGDYGYGFYDRWRRW